MPEEHERKTDSNRDYTGRSTTRNQGTVRKTHGFFAFKGGFKIENQAKRNLVKMLIELGNRHGVHEVFVDFLELSALAISNRFDRAFNEEREQRYLNIEKGYAQEDMNRYAEMLAQLFMSLQHEAETGKVNDVLGPIYHELCLHNKWRGQFFTPQEVCDMMGSITLGKPQEKMITVMEPCVGSGAMVLGFVNAMIDQKLNYIHHLKVRAVDNDLKCVHMAYLQLSLYGIPAIVVHGNSLTNEHWSAWRTPMFLLNGHLK